MVNKISNFISLFGGIGYIKLLIAAPKKQTHSCYKVQFIKDVKYFIC
jgi:hypothetical protein